jgi:hypothetical protein
MKNLKFIKKLSWNDVFEIWRKTEENLEHWQRYWQSQGYKSWADWRMEKVHAMEVNKMTWELYEVGAPQKTVPNWKGGPFTGWLKYFYAPLGKNTKNLPTFAELATSPAVANHHYVLDLIKTFPKSTTLTAVETSRGVVVIEGMHRACAIALSVAQGRPVKTKVKVALAKIKGNLIMKKK